MPTLLSSYIRFSLYFLIITCIFGLVGIIISQSGFAFLNQLLSFSVLLPYLVSFYLMTQHFINAHQATPTDKQRWQLSLGCLVIFWSYTILAVLLSMFFSDTKFDPSTIQQILDAPIFILIFGSILLGLNLILFILGFWFLGKPAQIMLAHQQR